MTKEYVYKIWDTHHDRRRRDTKPFYTRLATCKRIIGTAVDRFKIRKYYLVEEHETVVPREQFEFLYSLMMENDLPFDEKPTEDEYREGRLYMGDGLFVLRGGE